MKRQNAIPVKVETYVELSQLKANMKNSFDFKRFTWDQFFMRTIIKEKFNEISKAESIMKVEEWYDKTMKDVFPRDDVERLIRMIR